MCQTHMNMFCPSPRTWAFRHEDSKTSYDTYCRHHHSHRHSPSHGSSNITCEKYETHLARSTKASSSEILSKSSRRMMLLLPSTHQNIKSKGASEGDGRIHETNTKVRAGPNCTLLKIKNPKQRETLLPLGQNELKKICGWEALAASTRTEINNQACQGSCLKAANGT